MTGAGAPSNTHPLTESYSGFEDTNFTTGVGAGSFTQTMQGGRSESIRDISTSSEDYSQVSGQILQDGKAWVVFPHSSPLTAGTSCDSASAGEALVGGGVYLSPYLNPETALRQMSFLAPNITDKGSQSINGVTSTHYSATIEGTSHMRNDNCLPVGVSREETYSQRGTLDLWVDPSGRIVEEKVSATKTSVVTITGEPRNTGSTIAAEGTTHLSTTENLTIYFSDFGEPVNPQAPPASEVESGSQWVASLASNTFSSPAEPNTPASSVPSSSIASEATDDAAKEEALNAVTSFAAVFANVQNYASITLSQLQQFDPTLNWLPEGNAPTGFHSIGWKAGGNVMQGFWSPQRDISYYDTYSAGHLSYFTSPVHTPLIGTQPPMTTTAMYWLPQLQEVLNH